MTISWRGLGYLGFMIPLAMWGLASVIWSPFNYKVIRIVLLLAAVIVWFVGAKLNSAERDESEEAPHLAFGFPMQWFSVVVLCAAGLTLL